MQKDMVNNLPLFPSCSAIKAYLFMGGVSNEVVGMLAIPFNPASHSFASSTSAIPGAASFQRSRNSRNALLLCSTELSQGSGDYYSIPTFLSSGLNLGSERRRSNIKYILSVDIQEQACIWQREEFGQKLKRIDDF